MQVIEMDDGTSSVSVEILHIVYLSFNHLTHIHILSVVALCLYFSVLDEDDASIDKTIIACLVLLEIYPKQTVNHETSFHNDDNLIPR
ncbi:hypothetical protein ACJX0J_035914, partial [Zea mays]